MSHLSGANLQFLSFFGSGIDLVRVDREVSELMGKMEGKLPETVQIFQVYTQAEAISKMFNLGIFSVGHVFCSLISSAGFKPLCLFGSGNNYSSIPCGELSDSSVVNVDLNQILLITFIIVS